MPRSPRAAGASAPPFAARARRSETELLAAARRYAEWFLRGGTTTIEAKSGYGLSLEAEIKILRVIRRLGAEGLLRTVPTFPGRARSAGRISRPHGRATSTW